MTRIIIAAVLATPPAAAEPCPIEAPALARLRAEHAAMDRAGVACLRALDGARGERDRCRAEAAAELDRMARELAEAGARLDAAAVPPPGPVVRPWALVGIGGLVAAGGALGASAAGADTEGSIIAAAGAAAGAALLAAALTWAGAL